MGPKEIDTKEIHNKLLRFRQKRKATTEVASMYPDYQPYLTLSKSFLNFLALNEKNGNSTSTARTPSEGRVSIIINEGNNTLKYKTPHDSHTIDSPTWS